jgi:hypothetical protein
MLAKRIALLSFILAVSGPVAHAGLNDGIRPGPSPSPWLLPAMPKEPAYALSGSAQPIRAQRQSTEWRREARQVGNKVTVDVYVR